MENYKFLIDNENNAYLAISENRIETLNVSDTYDGNGQQISHYDAGDGFTLETKKAVDAINSYCEENELTYHLFKKGDYVSAFEHQDAFNAIFETDIGEEGMDYILYLTEVKGFNYWDGSNWKTIITQSDDGWIDYEVLDNEDLESELNEAIDTMDFIGESYGHRYYETDSYIIDESAFASAFEAYTVTRK